MYTDSVTYTVNLSERVEEGATRSASNFCQGRLRGEVANDFIVFVKPIIYFYILDPP